jgi:hypothetical protein
VRRTPEQNAMNAQLSAGNDSMRPASGNGMARFFTPANLDRYRILAGDRIDAPERHRVMQALAQEWRAFTRECQQGRPQLPKRGAAIPQAHKDS